MPRKRKLSLSNIRRFLGWSIGRKVIDVTSGDPPYLPDHDPEDAGHITLMFDNGGLIVFDGSEGFYCCDPAKAKPRKPPRKPARKTTRARKGERTHGRKGRSEDHGTRNP